MRERERTRNGRDDRMRDEGRSGGGSLGFWRHSSFCINTTGSHHVPPPASSAGLLRLWQYKLYYFFPCPLYAFYHSSRGPAGATRPCCMSQLVMRFSVHFRCFRLLCIFASFMLVSFLSCTFFFCFAKVRTAKVFAVACSPYSRRVGIRVFTNYRYYLISEIISRVRVIPSGMRHRLRSLCSRLFV